MSDLSTIVARKAPSAAASLARVGTIHLVVTKNVLEIMLFMMSQYNLPDFAAVVASATAAAAASLGTIGLVVAKEYY